MSDLAKRLPTAALLWLLASIILFGLSALSFVPNDLEQVLQREGSGVIRPNTNPVEVPLGEDGNVSFTATACITNEDSSPFDDPTFFLNRNCSIIAEEGATIWFQILLENESPFTLQNIALDSSQFGSIAPSDEGWLVEPITNGSRDPDAGWRDEAGTLAPEEGVAVYYASYTLPEDQADEYSSDWTLDFAIADEEVVLEEVAPDGTQISQTTVVRLSGEFPLVPDVWLTWFGSDSERVIDVQTIQTGRPLYMLTLLFVAIELAMFAIPYFKTDKLLRPIIRSTGIFFVFWSFFGHEVFWDQVLGWLLPSAANENNVEILYETNSVIEFAAQHLELVIVSSFIIIPLGLFVSILVTRDGFEDFLPLISGTVNLGQTIPTLAIVAIMAPIIGLGFQPAIIALVAYGLLPVVRNTIAGLEGVDPFIIQSAQGMGMTPLQILLQIELPIASRVIMAGIRTSMVINVGTAALGAYVISGGLGTLISNGLGRDIFPWVLLGALPAAALAVLLDYILGRIEFVLTPRGLQLET